MNNPNDADTQKQAPTLFTFVGTAFLHILNFVNLLPRGVYLIIDSLAELNAINCVDDDDHKFIKVPLEALIAQDVVERAGNEAQARTLENIPNVSTRDGCGQLRGIGNAAVECLLKAIDFAILFANGILPELRRMGGGELKCVEHMHFSGGCGGMGSAGGISLVRAIQRQFMEATDPEITSKVFVLGAITFCSPKFQRTTENASCALVEWTHMLQHPISNRVSTVLCVHELPPLELDSKTREALNLEYFIALFAEGFVEEIQRNSPNKQVAGNVGGTHLFRTDHFTALDDVRIASIIARVFGPKIKSIMLEKADVDSVDSVRFTPDHRRLKRERIESILQTAADLLIEEVIGATVAAAQVYCFHVRVQLLKGKAFDLEQVKITFGTPLVTEKEAAKRLRDLRTCYEVCFRKLEQIEKQSEAANEDLEWAMQAAVVAIRRLQSGWRGWIASGFKSFDRRMSQVEQALGDLRRASDEVLKLTAKITALEIALDELAEEDRLLVAKLTFLVKQLKSCLPQGDERRDRQLVKALPLDARFAKLVRYAESKPATQRELVEILATSVDSVTIEGLAVIAKCEPSIDAVVGSVLARKNTAYQSPSWGGETQLNPTHEKIVFPRVSAELQAKIETHAGDESGRIAFAGAASGSLNIVRIETVYSLKVADVIPPFYDAGVRQALASPLAPLFVVNEAAFKKLDYELPASITGESE